VTAVAYDNPGMTDILDLKGWTVHSKTQCGGEYVIDAECRIKKPA
jgi:hypothetical protein